MTAASRAARPAVRKLIEKEINAAVDDAFNRTIEALPLVPGADEVTLEEAARMFAAILRLSASAHMRAFAQVYGGTSYRLEKQ